MIVHICKEGVPLGVYLDAHLHAMQVCLHAYMEGSAHVGSSGDKHASLTTPLAIFPWLPLPHPTSPEAAGQGSAAAGSAARQQWPLMRFRG